VRKNSTLAKWRAGKATIGGWLWLANTHSAEVMANVGFDWLCVDLQHGLIEVGDLSRMLPAISTTETTPIVRVAGNDPKEIMKVLDTGAMGVIVPLVNYADEAAAAVSACRYPPDGTRSFGPIRASIYGGQGYAAEANGEIVCIVMIETKEGLGNVEEIVATPGLGGVFIGPMDLSLSLGLPPSGDSEDPRIVAAVDTILSTCKRARVPVGIYAGDLEVALKRLAAGFDFVSLCTDIFLMSRAAASELATARKALD
jgi:4-hydroxy-2-oxoheptanedioate aldolase